MVRIVPQQSTFCRGAFEVNVKVLFAIHSLVVQSQMPSTRPSCKQKAKVQPTFCISRFVMIYVLLKASIFSFHQVFHELLADCHERQKTLEIPASVGEESPRQWAAFNGITTVA